MKQLKRIALIAAACACVTGSTVPVLESTVIVAEAHSGRTDGRGGHRDNKNKSGLGSYHYHCGGYPAHLHENGVCPYASVPVSSSGGSSSSRESSAAVSATDSQGEESQAVTQEMMDQYAAVFDADYYYNNYEDLQSSIGRDDLKLFGHFLDCGMAEGRIGCENFNVNVYRENNPDLQEEFGDDLPRYYSHYMSSGCHEGRICR